MTRSPRRTSKRAPAKRAPAKRAPAKRAPARPATAAEAMGPVLALGYRPPLPLLVALENAVARGARLRVGAEDADEEDGTYLLVYLLEFATGAAAAPFRPALRAAGWRVLLTRRDPEVWTREDWVAAPTDLRKTMPLRGGRVRGLPAIIDPTAPWREADVRYMEVDRLPELGRLIELAEIQSGVAVRPDAVAALHRGLGEGGVVYGAFPWFGDDEDTVELQLAIPRDSRPFAVWASK